MADLKNSNRHEVFFGNFKGWLNHNLSSQWEVRLQSSIVFGAVAGQRLLVAVSTFACCMPDYCSFPEKSLWCLYSVGGNWCISSYELTSITALTCPPHPPPHTAHGFCVCVDSTVHISTWTMRASPQQWQHHQWGWTRRDWCEFTMHLPRRHISVSFLQDRELIIVFMQKKKKKKLDKENSLVPP